MNFQRIDFCCRHRRRHYHRTYVKHRTIIYRFVVFENMFNFSRSWKLFAE